MLASCVIVAKILQVGAFDENGKLTSKETKLTLANDNTDINYRQGPMGSMAGTLPRSIFVWKPTCKQKKSSIRKITSYILSKG